MKLCKDCKHTPHDDYLTCYRSVRVEGIDLRSGNEIRDGWKRTEDERFSGWLVARLTGACGKEGRFWEAKP